MCSWLCIFVFFFKQKTAYEMRISDWSSDVCSSDLVREPEAATSISYAENAQRVGMHPADSIRAFAALRDEGYGEEAIANRYGYDVGYVRKLLAMAGVSPKVINALASDKIDLACVQAFMLTGAHKRDRKSRRLNSSP